MLGCEVTTRSLSRRHIADAAGGYLGVLFPSVCCGWAGKERFPRENLQQGLAKSCASEPGPELEVEAVPGHVAVLKGSAIRLRRPCFSEGHALLLNA